MPAIIIRHALKHTRPVLPYVERLRIEPGKTIWHPKRKTKVYAKGWFSHVTAVGDFPGDIATVHATYAEWWLALKSIRVALRPVCLTNFKLTDELPPDPRAEVEALWERSSKCNQVEKEPQHL